MSEATTKKQTTQQDLRQPEATPEAGTRPIAGKSNDACGAEDARNAAVKRNKPEAVTTVDRDKNKGACLAAGLRQAEGDGRDKGVVNGNPKKRTSNSFGVSNKK